MLIPCLYISDTFKINMSKKRFRSSKKQGSDSEKGLKINTRRNRDQMQQSRDEGNERKVHEEIMDRRIRGGISLTKEEIAEAYKRAQEQWLKLPGSTMRPPTDVLLIQRRSKSQGTITASEQTHDDTHNGGSDFES